MQPRNLDYRNTVAATIADHTAGAAARSLFPHDEIPVTVEFKIHLLRAARGSHLECRGEVLKPGRRFTICEATVRAVDGETRTAVAKLIATMAPVSGP